MPGQQLSTSDAISLLQKTDCIEGESIYDQLSSVLLKILEDKPTGEVDLLKTYLLVKRTGFDTAETTKPLVEQDAQDVAKSKDAAKLFGLPDVPIDPETGEPVEADAPNEYESENILNDAALLDAVGAGLGRQEMYAAMLAVKQLGENPTLGVKTVRFFGKVLGVYADYYIFETTLKEAAEEEETGLESDVPKEVGSGTNGYTYFVSNQLGGALTKLADVTPAQIKAARTLKKLFTGKLSAEVSTYPAFPGLEANYLRAQIARIAATTVLCPGGYFTATEDGSLEKSEEFAPQEASEMTTPAAWAHRYPHIKKQGRCVVFKKEEEEVPEGQEPPPVNEEETEEGPAPLASLENDSPVDGGDAWTPLFSSATQTVKFQVAGVSSALWPGAFAVTAGGAFSNIYVGWGIKNAPYVPQPPPPIATEFDWSLLESAEIPLKPEPPGPEDEAAEGEEEDA